MALQNKKTVYAALVGVLALMGGIFYYGNLDTVQIEQVEIELTNVELIDVDTTNNQAKFNVTFLVKNPSDKTFTVPLIGYDLYGDGDVTLTYNSSNNSLTSQNGNAYDENNPFEIWTELKDPATQNTSFFKPNNPSNLSYSIVGGHPKLNWSGSSLPSNARYKLYRNNVVVATNITTSYYTDTGVSVPGTNSFVYKVRAHLPTPYSASSTNTTNNVTVRRAQSNTNNKSLSGLLPVNLNSTNYPNPFNPSTLIAFDLPVKSNVQITIYNILGNEIKSFGKQMFDPGNHSIFWDGKDNSGFSVSSGVYIYILRADDAVNKLTTSVSGKMILGR